MNENLIYDSKRSHLVCTRMIIQYHPNLDYGHCNCQSQDEIFSNEQKRKNRNIQNNKDETHEI